ncbi:MAG: methyltransferase domain-containing protein [Chloroflexi bacterium]|nr:methyltransferase domain-containing protein [Chloroflexota bacterium]
MTMPSYEEIYAQHAEEYDAMVAREDYQGNLLTTLQRLRPLSGLDVVEMGAGTGRFTRLLAPLVRTIRAYDASQHMLDKAAATLQPLALNNWTLQQAQHKALPTAAASADLCLAGWTFGHAIAWHGVHWPREIGAALREMFRVLRPGGMAVIVETLGTGEETPNPPAHLLGYYAWLEAEHGFMRVMLRTDYRFDTLEQGQTLAGFFFGPEMAEKIRLNQWQILPECTGVWYKVP